MMCVLLAINLPGDGSRILTETEAAGEDDEDWSTLGRTGTGEESVLSSGHRFPASPFHQSVDSQQFTGDIPGATGSAFPVLQH
jgi:hypothetical protein